jgi:YcxB-like protein
MSIKTDIMPKDFKAFTRFITVGFDGGHSIYKLLFGSALVMGIILGIALAFADVRLHIASLMAGLFGGVFWLVIFSRLQARNMGPATDGLFFGPRTVSITDDGLREKAEKYDSLFNWSSVRSAESVGEYIFVLVDRNAGIIVPHRAFASDAERDQFLAEIRKRTTPVAHKAAT